MGTINYKEIALLYMCTCYIMLLTAILQRQYYFAKTVIAKYHNDFTRGKPPPLITCLQEENY